MVGRALSFGSAASAYEQFRPCYPDELVDEVMTYVGRPVRTALEIGAGTGKATRVFAGRGIAVTATDPDPAMLMELRKHVPASVVTVQGAFEDVPLTSTYDLVFAAASLHWTEPADRWSRVAALLNPEGVFASFGGQMFLADKAVEEAVRAARSQFLADDGVPSPDGTPADSPMQWPGTELVRSNRFIDVRQSTIERRTTMSALDYVGHLSTISAYLELPVSVRERVLDRIHAVLPERVTLVADLTLHLARMSSHL
jgi:SAM-dependent methyltransferase